MTSATTELAMWLLLWIILAGVLMLVSWRRSAIGAGLVFAYVANFAVIHWFGALVHALPWNQFADSTNTVVGFRESSWGFAAFVVGSLFLAPWLDRRRPHAGRSPADPDIGKRLAWAYLLIGLAFWPLSFTQLIQIPSMSSVIAMGKQMTLVGICLHCWLAWLRWDLVSLRNWLLLAAAFPAITVITQGFLGYGVAAVIMTCAFIATFYKPRWPVVVFGLAGVYLGLSLYLAYASSRGAIRESVWGGASFENRVSTVGQALSNFSLFDIRDDLHLRSVDARLNQNELVGAAVAYTPSRQDYAYGATYTQALISLVPRIVWPDKPVKAGSMGLVTVYTGIYFDVNTSVGLGQVLEFYINYGRFGVLIGFLLLGALLGQIDRRAARSLHAGDWHGFALWFLIGIGVLQVGGSLVEVTASMAAAAVAAWAVRYWLLGRMRARSPKIVPQHLRY